MKKKESLLITLEIFDYCAMHNCGKGKAVRELGYTGMEFNCALCEHTGYAGGTKTPCKKCPIDWPETNAFHTTHCGRSHYYTWQKAREEYNNLDTAFYANKIANLALETLNRLYPEE